MATKSVLTVLNAYARSIGPWTRSAGDASGKKSDRMGQNSHLSNDQPEIVKQAVKSIAVVDDEKELCFLFSILIKRLGYHAECVAYDGDEIVQLVLEDSVHPDLILMDYRMPTMNGIQAAERILRVRPE